MVVCAKATPPMLNTTATIQSVILSNQPSNKCSSNRALKLGGWIWTLLARADATGKKTMANRNPPSPPIRFMRYLKGRGPTVRQGRKKAN
ncbi:hypothetical protein GCM10008957_25020 [Deinococcus ruber]|uniref:Uncharacterized protein n=1 Tax=Deinococcus ruber TaxID=1848197 RepID=A0A918C8Q7_9DEIO|nr:hypothetical protein GCM10008957_25020 [Deinococcus ruber]